MVCLPCVTKSSASVNAVVHPRPPPSVPLRLSSPAPGVCGAAGHPHPTASRGQHLVRHRPLGDGVESPPHFPPTAPYPPHTAPAQQVLQPVAPERRSLPISPRNRQQTPRATIDAYQAV